MVLWLRIREVKAGAQHLRRECTASRLVEEVIAIVNCPIKDALEYKEVFWRHELWRKLGSGPGSGYGLASASGGSTGEDADAGDIPSIGSICPEREQARGVQQVLARHCARKCLFPK